MKSVFLVTHTYERPTGEEEVKAVGVYKSKKDAQLAVRRKKRHEGFRDYPRGFHVSEFELGRDQWSEGFITIPTKQKPNQASQPTPLKRRG